VAPGRTAVLAPPIARMPQRIDMPKPSMQAVNGEMQVKFRT
jgi:hypothetical protein